LLSYRPPTLLLLLVVALAVLAMLRRSRVSSFVLRTRGPYAQFLEAVVSLPWAPRRFATSTGSTTDAAPPGAPLAGQPHGPPGSLSEAPLRTGDGLATAAGGAAPCNVPRELLEINLEHSMDGDDVYVALFKRSGGMNFCKKCGRPASQHAARSPPPLTSRPQQPWAHAQRLDTLDAVRAAAQPLEWAKHGHDTPVHA